MSQEIELKLALPATGPARLVEHPQLAGREAPPRRLANTYYDSNDGALERARVALRIRQTPEGCVQTLKTAGRGQGGLSVRGEWEWPIAGPTLDLAGLAALPPMRELGDEVLEALAPRFATDFVRRTWHLETAEGRIELALDEGEVRAGEHRTTIRELELELENGDPAALWRLAEALTDRVPLRPASASKAARGAALLAGAWSLPGDDGALKPPAALFERAMAALDAAADSGEARFEAEAQEALARLAALGDDRIRRDANTLAEALGRPDWLTPGFGQASLALARALYQSPA